MKRSYVFVTVSLLCPVFAAAGEIHGTVTENGKVIGSGASIEVRCGEKTYSAATDKFGSFRLYVPEKGTCALHVHYQNQAPSREIVSFEESTRYDLALAKEGDQYVLRRR